MSMKTAFSLCGMESKHEKGARLYEYSYIDVPCIE